MSHPLLRRTKPNDLFDCASPMSVTHGHVRPDEALLYRVVDYSTLGCEITVRMLDIACRPVDFACRYAGLGPDRRRTAVTGPVLGSRWIRTERLHCPRARCG